jgi:hypothetical protein
MIDPEKKLWQSVLLTAVNDALTTKKQQNSIYSYKIVEDAREWLLNNNGHYFRVCSMADINPLALREKVKEVLSFNKYVSSKLEGNNLAGDIDNHDSFES